MHETAFNGRDLVLEVCDGGHPVSIVTFQAHDPGLQALTPGPFLYGFGKGLFAPAGFNEFIIKRSRNHWYQTAEMIEVARLIRQRAGQGRLVTYGGSMGGFAAINFAPLLQADCFIALSPLHDIAPGNEAGETRWQADADLLDFPYNLIRSGACRAASGFVFYCRTSPDARHAALIARDTAARLLPVAYGGHPCSFYLNDTYGLKALVQEIATGTFDPGQFYRRLEERTAQSHYPHEQEASRLERAGDLQGAITALRIATERARAEAAAKSSSRPGGPARLQARLDALLRQAGPGAG